MRTDQELRELCKGLDIVADNKMKRLECIGHAVRTYQTRTVKKIFESKPKINTRSGRPRFRWL